MTRIDHCSPNHSAGISWVEAYFTFPLWVRGHLDAGRPSHLALYGLAHTADFLKTWLFPAEGLEHSPMPLGFRGDK